MSNLSQFFGNSGGGGGGIPAERWYTSSGTFTTPVASTYLISVIGGGGGACTTQDWNGGGYSYVGGGGGGGGFTQSRVSLTANTTLTVIVGGFGYGTFGAAGTQGNPGGSSSVSGAGLSLIANGGQGGVSGSLTSGAGGTASGGNLINASGTSNGMNEGTSGFFNSILWSNTVNAATWTNDSQGAYTQQLFQGTIKGRILSPNHPTTFIHTIGKGGRGHNGPNYSNSFTNFFSGTGGMVIIEWTY